MAKSPRGTVEFSAEGWRLYCSKCGEPRPPTTGHMCRDCGREAVKKWREKNPEANRILSQRDYQRRRETDMESLRETWRKARIKYAAKKKEES